MSRKKKEQPVDFFEEKDIFGLDKPKPRTLNKENPKAAQEQRNPETDIIINYRLPSLLTRIQALIIDVIIIITVFLLAGTLIDFFGEVPGWVRGLILISTLYIYEPFCVAFYGGTLGHYLMKIRVKNVNNPEKNIMFLLALFRFIIKSLLGWLSFISVTSNKRKRAIHDMLSGSIVLGK